MILVKKGGKLPEGHIQSWFWERGNLKDSLTLKLPASTHPSAWVTTLTGTLGNYVLPQRYLFSVRSCALVSSVVQTEALFSWQ